MQPQGPSERIDARDLPEIATAEPTGLAGIEGRHPSVKHFGPLFAYGHLPPHLRGLSELFAVMAAKTMSMCQDGPELSAALRKLVEAKDCAVRQRVIDHSEGK